MDREAEGEPVCEGDEDDLREGVADEHREARGDADCEAIERDGVKVALADRERGAEPVREPQPVALPLWVLEAPPLPLLAREAEGAGDPVLVAKMDTETLIENDDAPEAVRALERVELREAEATGEGHADDDAVLRPVVVFDAHGEPVRRPEGLTVLEAFTLLRVWAGVEHADAEYEDDMVGERVTKPEEVALGEREGVKDARGEAVAFVEGESTPVLEVDIVGKGEGEVERASVMVRVGVVRPDSEPLAVTVVEGEGGAEAVMERVPSQSAAVSAICPQKAAPLEDMQRAGVPAGQNAPGVWHQ